MPSILKDPTHILIEIKPLRAPLKIKSIQHFSRRLN